MADPATPNQPGANPEPNQNPADVAAPTDDKGTAAADQSSLQTAGAPSQEQPQQAQSFGAKAVGLSFNPSNNADVQKLKEAAAAFIDACNDLRLNAKDEQVRMYSVAITEAQTAQMWAVKAATWQA